MVAWAQSSNYLTNQLYARGLLVSVRNQELHKPALELFVLIVTIGSFPWTGVFWHPMLPWSSFVCIFFNFLSAFPTCEIKTSWLVRRKSMLGQFDGTGHMLRFTRISVFRQTVVRYSPETCGHFYSPSSKQDDLSVKMPYSPMTFSAVHPRSRLSSSISASSSWL